MGSGNTVEIKDIPAFPAKVTAIRDAIAQLRAAVAALSQIPDTAVKEAASFTRDGSPAPIYSPMVEALRGWAGKLAPTVAALCDSSEAAADTLARKFEGIVATDNAGAAAIRSLGSDGPASLVAKLAPAGSAAGDGAAGGKSLADLEKEIGAKAGVAYVPLFGDNREVKIVGELQDGDAWSTIKAPMALAAMRENGGQLTPDITAALTRSDNDAANRIWSSLGDPQTAAQRVQEVLRGSGDMTTQVNAVKDSQFSAYGQTQWSLENQLRFMSHLGQDPNGAQILDAMSHVAADQQWGLGQLEGSQFKGGWGPSGDNGEYLTRQMGIVDGPGGRYAVATMVAPDSGGFQDGQAAMTALSKWLELQ